MLKKHTPKKPSCKLETLIKRESKRIHSKTVILQFKKFLSFTCIHSDKLEAFIDLFSRATRRWEEPQLHFHFKTTTAHCPIAFFHLLSFPAANPKRTMLTLTKEYNHPLNN